MYVNGVYLMYHTLMHRSVKSAPDPNRLCIHYLQQKKDDNLYHYYVYEQLNMRETHWLWMKTGIMYSGILDFCLMITNVRKLALQHMLGKSPSNKCLEINTKMHLMCLESFLQCSKKYLTCHSSCIGHFLTNGHLIPMLVGPPVLANPIVVFRSDHNVL